MSLSFNNRHQTPVELTSSGKMVAPNYNSTPVFSVMPSYNVLPNQSQQFISQPLVLPQSTQNVPVQNRVPYVGAIPGTMPRMFMPINPMAATIKPSIPDPNKIFQEQRRIEKERNFQLQQERLRQFTIAGKKTHLNAENLIDSMFGPKKSSVTSAKNSGATDDDFGDFKSVPFTAVDTSSASSSSINNLKKEFDSLKQTPNTNSKDSVSLFSSEPQSKYFIEQQKKSSSDILQNFTSSKEDKYSVFRSLQENDCTSLFGDSVFNNLNNEKSDIELCKKSDTENSGMSDLNPSNPMLDDDDFGEFLHADVPSINIPTTVVEFADFSNFKETESNSTEDTDEFGEFTSSVAVLPKPETVPDYLLHLKDNISLGESQSVSSLELGTFDGGSGESKCSLSRQGSIPSLDLKSICLDGIDSEDCLGEGQFLTRASKSPSPVDNNKCSDDSESANVSPRLTFKASTLPLTDKYSVIRQEKEKEEDCHVSSWVRSLKGCVDILKSTKKIFNQMSCSSVCNQVLMSEEGSNYVKSIVEVYKIVCRIRFSSKAVGKQTIGVLDLLKEADQLWQTVSGFFASTTFMPENSALDFSSAVLHSKPENNTKACGLCLLNVETRNLKKEDTPILSYGGRNYHSACANFWVNCVDPLLPALALPQLL